jgi:hypothetical protein
MSDKIKTFYFNTGVTRYGHRPPVPLVGNQIWSPNGVKLIPFRVRGVPDGATFMFSSDNPHLPESDCDGIIVVPILPEPDDGGGLCSSYAYFRKALIDDSQKSDY